MYFNKPVSYQYSDKFLGIEGECEGIQEGECEGIQEGECEVCLLCLRNIHFVIYLKVFNILLFYGLRLPQWIGIHSQRIGQEGFK